VRAGGDGEAKARAVFETRLGTMATLGNAGRVLGKRRRSEHTVHNESERGINKPIIDSEAGYQGLDSHTRGHVLEWKNMVGTGSAETQHTIDVTAIVGSLGYEAIG